MSSEGGTTVLWQAESTHPKLAERLKEDLREVVDPELGLNIIELGLVRDVIIEEQKAHVNMIMTTPFCPYAPALLEMTRSKAKTSLDRETTIEMGVEMWDPSYMEEGAGAEWGLF
ncbi:MAG: iron-sulfur cluster assembly protein [Anaerolineales bacterium]|jgi:metal-sulfur cluster biosynthetic enzyme